MPTKVKQPCKYAWCHEHRPCPLHDNVTIPVRRADQRPSAARRGYGYAWRKRSAEFLSTHPYCVDCGKPATIPDHSPRTRRELVEAGVPDPDADQYLEARCASCHSRKTAVHDGGFGQRRGGG